MSDNKEHLERFIQRLTHTQVRELWDEREALRKEKARLDALLTEMLEWHHSEATKVGNEYFLYFEREGAEDFIEYKGATMKEALDELMGGTE